MTNPHINANYVIVLDEDGRHPFVVDTLFPTLDEADAYAATYLVGKRDHRIIPVPKRKA